MGNTSSKSDQPKVFLPKTPTEFSPALINKLESSLESDYTRAQYSEKYIQDRVAEELRKIQKQAQEELSKASEKISHVSESALGAYDSASLHKRLDQIASSLEARPKRGKFPKEADEAREALVTCLKDNQGKPLKCQEEFEKFRAQVAQLS